MGVTRQYEVAKRMSKSRQQHTSRVGLNDDEKQINHARNPQVGPVPTPFGGAGLPIQWNERAIGSCGEEEHCQGDDEHRFARAAAAAAGKKDGSSAGHLQVVVGLLWSWQQSPEVAEEGQEEHR